MDKNLVIAIDGVVASGKGTLARLVAEKLGYIHIDTGSIFRAITLEVVRKKIDLEDVKSIVALLDTLRISFVFNGDYGRNEILLNGEHVESSIRNPDISKKVPIVAHISEVREFARSLQHKYAEKGGIVLDGRDIGTVVFPNADLKIFLDAEAAVRAKRRHKELQEKGQIANYRDILDDLNSRDSYDRAAKISPLKQADDAIFIDSTNMPIPEVVDMVYKLAKEKL
ncbi:MAG: cytidylate kinase [Candidatus Paceibacteria bacterium]|jgi:cytidylate kinase